MARMQVLILDNTRARMRKRHPKSEVEQALQYAEENGFEVIDGGRGHSWGKVMCPSRDPSDWCARPIYVWSTPQNPGTHAKRIRQAVARCPHKDD
jgi:hypothetical protein